MRSCIALLLTSAIGCGGGTQCPAPSHPVPPADDRALLDGVWELVEPEGHRAMLIISGDRMCTARTLADRPAIPDDATDQMREEIELVHHRSAWGRCASLEMRGNTTRVTWLFAERPEEEGLHVDFVLDVTEAELRAHNPALNHRYVYRRVR